MSRTGGDARRGSSLLDVSKSRGLLLGLRDYPPFGKQSEISWWLRPTVRCGCHRAHRTPFWLGIGIRLIRNRHILDAAVTLKEGSLK